jgi:hypothetical protein
MRTWFRRAGGVIPLVVTLVVLLHGTQAGASDRPVHVGEYAHRAVGDLDGDGGEDILAYQTTSDGHNEGPQTPTLVVRRGTDGSVLWTKATPESFDSIVAARVGPDGEPGLVMRQFERATVATGNVYVDHQRMTFTAFDGAGRQLWRYVAPEATAVLPAAALGANSFMGSVFLDALPGPADDLALTGRTRGVDTVTVVDGATGVAGAIVSDTESPAGTGTYAVADPTGVGLDTLARVGTRRGAPTVVALYDAASGKQRWRRSDLPSRGDRGVGVIEGVGDVSGDGHQDVAVVVGGADDEAAVALLDGATGATLWTRRADRAYGVGDTDGDGRGEVGVAAATRGREPVALQFDVVDAEEDLLGHTEFRGSSTLYSYLFFEVDVLDDVDADGARDMHYRLLGHPTGPASGSTYLDPREVDLLDQRVVSAGRPRRCGGPSARRRSAVASTARARTS